MQNVTEIGQPAAELWPKPTFNFQHGTIRHLEFQKFPYCLRAYLVQRTKFHQNQMIFR